MRVIPFPPGSRHIAFLKLRPKQEITHAIRRHVYSTPIAAKQARNQWSRSLWFSSAGVVTFLALYGLYETNASADNVQALRPDAFTPFTLVSREPISSTSSVFTLRPKAAGQNARVYDEAWAKGVWSVQVKQPQLQIARSYTPLPCIDTAEATEPSDLKFLIRKDPKGEVSGYLHRLPIGAQIELRGPHLEYVIPDDVSEVLFLAGGTGIAPALQLVHTLLKSRSSPTAKLPTIRIMWANRRQEDALDLPNKPQTSSAQAIEIPLLKAKHQAELSFRYFVDEDQTFIKEATLLSLLSNSRRKGEVAGKKLILISGPDGFVNYSAGPKVWKGGLELQGPLGGVLKKLNLDGWEVWKL